MWTAVLFKKRKEPGLNSKRLFLECNVSINFNFANGKNFLLSVLHSAEIYKKKQNRGIKKFPFVMGSFNASCQGVARKIKKHHALFSNHIESCLLLHFLCVSTAIILRSVDEHYRGEVCQTTSQLLRWLMHIFMSFLFEKTFGMWLYILWNSPHLVFTKWVTSWNCFLGHPWQWITGF